MIELNRAVFFRDKKVHRVPPVSLTFGAAEVTKSFEIKVNALVHTAIVIMPNWANNVFAVLTVLNSEGEEVFRSNNLGRNHKHVIQNMRNYCYLNEISTIQLDLSGVPGADDTATISLVLE